MTGQEQGWQSLKLIRSRVVAKNLKPNGKCKYCGMPIYWIQIDLKKGLRWIAYEDGMHGSQDEKVLYNHRNVSQARKSCVFAEDYKGEKNGKNQLLKTY